MRKWFIRGSLVLLALIAGLAVYYFNLPWADVRPDALRGDVDVAQASKRGRALLDQVAAAHGLDSLRKHKTMEVVAVDTWSGGAPWFANDAQKLRSRRAIGTFTSNMLLMDGPEKGDLWGLQDWKPYKMKATGNALEWLEEDQAIEFYLPALQYLDELPMRLAGADVVLDVGTEELFGEDYKLLFATWGDVEPHGEADQYVVWIDPETHRIAKVTYTLRALENTRGALMKPLMRMLGVGTMHFGDYRDVNGVQFPFTQHVTGGTAMDTEDPHANFVHKLDVESVGFDGFPVEELCPDSTKGVGGDWKEASAASSGHTTAVCLSYL